MLHLYEYEEYRNIKEGIIGDTWNWLKNLIKKKLLDKKDKIESNINPEAQPLINDISRFLEYIKNITKKYRVASSEMKEIALTEKYIEVGTLQFGILDKAVELILDSVCGPKTNTLYRFAFMPDSLDIAVAETLYTDLLSKKIPENKMIDYHNKIVKTSTYKRK